MQDFSEMQRKQQQDYQRSRDPFQYGQQVAQRRYSEIMSNLENQRQATQQSYGDLYSRARQGALGGLAAGGPTLSGGMAQQRTDYISALEMQELGRMGQSREGTMRDLYAQGQAAFSNAQLEGQQATQMEVQNRQTNLQLVQQRQAILDSDLPEAQKQAQLAALEGAGGLGNVSAAPEAVSFGKALTITGGIGLTGAAVAKSIAFAGSQASGVAGLIYKQGGLLARTATGAGGAFKAAATKEAAKTIALAFKGKTGVAALWQGTKLALIKSGLVKGALTTVGGKGVVALGVAGKGLLAAVGPVGWGVLAVLGTAAVIAGISKLARG
jgi:hypothetical protein